MKKTILFAIAVLALASCSKQEGLTDDCSDEIRFNITMPDGGRMKSATKATATSFQSGDAVSLYAVEYAGQTPMPLQVGGNFLNNEKLTYNGSAWQAARTLYWSESACDFYALYPYQPSIGSIEKYPFSLNANQDGQGYEESDLLFAKAEAVSRTDGSVNLQFRHMMSKCRVVVEKGEKFEGDIPDDIVCHIYNTMVDCMVDLEAGSVEKNPFGVKKTITMKKLSNAEFEAVLVPQNLEKRTPLIELTMGGIAYLLETSLSFRPGYVHTLTVTLNTSPDQEMIEININPDVDDWN